MKSGLRRPLFSVALRGARFMPVNWNDSDAAGTEKRRIKPTEPESNFGPFIFPAICKHLWPDYTAAELAKIGDSHTRTAEFWLSGRVEPPPIVFAVVYAEVIRRDRAARAIGVRR